MYKTLFNQRKALVFKQFTHKGWALFACLGRVVVIGVLSASTIEASTVAAKKPKAKSQQLIADPDTARTDKEMTLDDIEVTASRAPLALGQAARMVTVLTRDDIQAAPVQSVNDLLKYAAGVDVRQRGPLGAQTDISIRGGTQEQITILLNGINICDAQTGHNTFDLPCSLADIERIEILEGPAARVYGTSSMMGAINVVTKRGERKEERGKRIDLHLEGGSYGYISAASRISLSSLLFPLSSISANYSRSDGYSRSKAGHLNSDYEGFKTFFQTSLPSLFGEGSGVRFSAGLSTRGYGSNMFWSSKYDEQYEHTVKLFTALQSDIDAGSFHFQPNLYWNRSHDRFELLRGDESKVPYNRHRTDVLGANLNSWFDSPLGRTAFGGEMRREYITSTNLGEPMETPNGHYSHELGRTNLSFHLEHNIVMRRFTLSAGFMATSSHSTLHQESLRFYPGIDASLRLGERWKVYASYNESLRLPSFTELYYSVGGHKADKHLKPEELRAVECGIKYFAPRLTARVSAFHHHQRNTIDWVMDLTEDGEPKTGGEWRSVNLTKINTLGFEGEAILHASRFTLHFNYCYLHQQKGELPHLQSRYSLEYLRHKLTASLQLPLTEQLGFVVKYRFQDRMGTYTDTDGHVQAYRPYSVVDTRLTWQTDSYALYAEANNLFNAHYVDYGCVPQPGCWLVVGVRSNL